MCTEQVVSARAYANQFLSYNSLRIKIIDMRTLQAYSCLNSEQIDTHFNSVGGQERGKVNAWDGHGENKYHKYRVLPHRVTALL